MSLILEIEPKPEEEKKQGKHKVKVIKSRSFQAHLLSYVEADSLYESGANAKDNVKRPVLVVYGGTENAMKPFTANLRLGRPANIVDNERNYRNITGKMEILKSQPYRFITQRVYGVNGSNGEPLCVVTAYLPEFFTMKPLLIDSDKCSFVAIPPKWWIDERTRELMENPDLCQSLSRFIQAAGFCDVLKLTNEQVLSMLPYAVYFMAFLTERTSLALINGFEFQLQVFLTALKSGVAKIYNSNRDGMWSFADSTDYKSYVEDGTAKTGFATGVICNVPQERLETFISQQSKLYQQVQKKLDELYPERVAERDEKRKASREAIQRMLENAQRAEKVEPIYIETAREVVELPPIQVEEEDPYLEHALENYDDYAEFMDKVEKGEIPSLVEVPTGDGFIEFVEPGEVVEDYDAILADIESFISDTGAAIVEIGAPVVSIVEPEPVPVKKPVKKEKVTVDNVTRHFKPTGLEQLTIEFGMEIVNLYEEKPKPKRKQLAKAS